MPATGQDPSARRALVLGASGAIGAAIGLALEADGAQVVGTSRRGGDGLLAVDPFGPAGMAALDDAGPFDAVVWAQGRNAGDAVTAFDLATFEDVLRANVTFVAVTMAHLAEGDRLRDGARLCVLSSIWQVVARPAKLSYVVSKAALGGLVASAAVDLAGRGMLVNAVLPSATDTPMTREMLSAEQMRRFGDATGHGRMTSLDDVAGLAAWLCSPRNTGVSGQSIAADLGFTVRRDV